MNEKFIAQLIAELIESQGVALGMLAAAVAKQVDPEKLTADLRAQLQAAKMTNKMPGATEKIATHALAAAEAETALRRRGTRPDA